MRNGILLLDKPAGPSSARVLGPVKRALATKKIGHTGTLDPFASGLLVLMVNGATRLASRFSALDKEYDAVVRFGEQTDTLDPEGTVVERAPLPAADSLFAVLTRFRGEIEQRPPAYSAIHVEGERAYERARRGETVVIPSRSVCIHELSMEYLQEDRYRMYVRCSSGTYIRSLARDIAHAAGSVASLETLRRISVGPFSVTDAVEAGPGGGDSFSISDTALISVGDALSRLGNVFFLSVSEDVVPLVRNGRELDSAPMSSIRESLTRLVAPDVPVLLTTHDGEELALCEHSSRGWVYRSVFPG